MKCLHSFPIAVPLAAAMLFAQAQSEDPPKPPQPAQQQPQAQQQPDPDPGRAAGQADMARVKTYLGTIVDAACTQAGALSPDASSPDKKPKAEDARKDVLDHCRPKASTAAYALLTDDGHFLKFDATGNTQVVTQAGDKKNINNMKASVTGVIEGTVLKVQTLAMM